MAGKIQLTNIVSEGCGVGISLSADMGCDVSIDRVTSINCGIGILQRDPQSLASQLGLPLDTPPEAIIEAARAIQGQSVSEVEKIGVLSSLPIWTYLKRATDVAKATAALIGAAKAIAAAFQSMG